MSVDREVLVWCDGEDCCNNFGVGKFCNTAEEARGAATDYDWLNVGGRDLCPECAMKRDGEGGGT